MPIRKLSALLINQIAAGEVIERPASVVKELVENSLDAGSTRIEISVEQGGRELIRVSDDGAGIAAEQLPLAVAAHATSKLTSAEDLAAVATLGFRGEALASIASVSRLVITSRSRQGEAAEDAGASLESSGDKVGQVKPAAIAPGTVIEVRDLFFNTPARQKFMRTASTEFGHISDTLVRMAMVHHRVAFRLLHNGRVVLDLASDADPLNRAVELLGKEIAEGLLAFEHNEPADKGGARVWGLAGVPALGRATSKQQYLYVNGRAVRDRNLAHALKEAYRGLMPPDRQPLAVVFLEIDPRAVDVNVHPAKAEVRFHQPSHVHGLVLAAVRQRLLASDLTPSAALERSAFTLSADSSQPSLLDPGHGRAEGAPSGPITTASEFVDYFRRMDPAQKGFVYQQVREAIARDDPQAMHDQDTAEPAGPGAQASPLQRLKILQVHESYVVTQDDEGLLIVDQHALHERVMFEELRRRVLGEGRKLESQRLLMPATFEANARRQALLKDLEGLLARIGVEAEPIGPSTVGIHAFASFLFDRHVDPAEFVTELLDKAEEGELEASGATAEESALHKVLDMMACKAAVKAGDRMGEDELAALLAKRQEIERSSNCPHGRPTTLRLSLRDLEKQFGRG